MLTRKKRLISNDGLLDRGFQFVPQVEQDYIRQFAGWMGITGFTYTRQEYVRIRRLEKKLRFSKEDIEELERDYCSTHIMARKIRKGAHNFIAGICYDATICNYANIATAIKIMGTAAAVS